MTKQEAIKIFGKTGADLGRALGVTRQQIHNMPDLLTNQYKDRVLGAAFRLKKPIPKQFLQERR